MYKDKNTESDPGRDQSRYPHGKIYYGDLGKVFLADGDAWRCRVRTSWRSGNCTDLPSLYHVGIYGSDSILKDVINALKAAGLTIAYLGVETGVPTVKGHQRRSIEGMSQAGRRL